MNNRLQFRHHREIFDTREAAIEYIYSQIRFADNGLAKDERSYGFSLLAEPSILLYKNEDDETDPHLLIAIGSATNEGTQYSDNRFCIIDIDKTESEIEDLWGEIEKLIQSLTLVTRDTDTLKLYSEKTDDGTILSGDVKVADAHIFNNLRLPNRIMTTEDGLYTYVNLEYDEERETFTFVVSNAETGELDKTSINMTNNYVVSGTYSVEDESLHLNMKDGGEVVIDLENLIDEWDVEGDASKTPIVLTKERVGYGDDSQHNHVEPWQDILRADVRLADMTHNILKKTSDGRYLYVNGMADNIFYFKDGVEITVAEALNECSKKKVSSDGNNIIYEKPDGFFASATLKYLSRENTLVFTASNVTGGTTVENIRLNTVELFKEIYYDNTSEELVILYVDNTGELKTVRIPIGEMLMNWEWDIVNDGHNVKLHKERVVGGSDKVSADADIFEGHDNILEDLNHQLYVRGTSDNIKYGDNSTVKAELDKLIASDININSRLNEVSGKVDTLREDLDAEIERSTSEDERIENKLDEEITRSTDKDTEHDTEINTIKEIIGSGFTTDTHETITYRFNELSAKTDIISARTETIASDLATLSATTEAEIQRAISEEQRIEKKFDDALGEGFDIRNTVRDEFDREKSEREAADNFLSGAIDSLSASCEGKLVDVINVDHSINVDKTDAVRPVISVNLSTEVEDGKENIIKLNNDGLYAGVDLDYVFNETVGTNQLIFKTTNGTKVFDMKTNSVVDKIYYDPTREAIIVEYTVNGQRMPDVVIPVGDLINEWRVSDSTDGAIRLTKTRESGSTQDVLYAETIISAHEDNLLINDNGALYVPGADIEGLSGRVDALEDDVDGLRELINTERIERISADTSLNEKINTEITNRVNADNDLLNLIHQEEDRAKSAESALTHSLEIERIERQNADNTLNQKIETEITNRENADTLLQTNIDNEAATRLSEDTRIESKLDAEIARSTSKDENLQTQITAEVNRATSAESSIREALTIETATRQVEDSNLSTLINNEITRATGAESALTIMINAERDARETEDEHIWAKIRPIEFYDTTTIHNDRVRNSGENPDEVRHSVIIAQADKNIIVADDNLGGLYATARLGYNQSANALTIYGPNDQIINTVTLGPGSLIKDISYDYEEKDLVVTYRRAGEDEDTIMKFPVADLFNEWDVQNPSEGSALELHKESQAGETGNVDKIWGRVLLTGAVERPDGTIDYGDNMIRIVNNGLYVSGAGISGVTEDIACLSGETKSIEDVLGVSGNCGQQISYPATQGCLLSAATSYAEADELLEAALCNIGNLLNGKDSPSTSINIDDEGFSVDVRLSHGNSNQMTDAELTITDFSGEEIEQGYNDFTDTNVLRLVDLTDRGITPDFGSNGLYLSNDWDCGQYVQGERYGTDESESAQNIFNQRFRNGVRH